MRHDHHHDHNHDHDHPASEPSEPALSTSQELNGGNATGKPNFTWAQAAEQISRDNRKWDGGALGSAGTVTYSFLSNAAAGSDFNQLTAAQIASAQTAMTLWSEVANIDFRAAGGGTNVSSNGEIQFKGYDGGGGGFASWSMRGGGETLAMNNATVALGGNSLSLALHEVGHAIGLSHPGDYNGGGNSYARDAEFYQDSEQYSVMSYWSGSNTGADLGKFIFNANGQGQYIGGATGLGLFDIAAIQRVYGANTDTYKTSTTYGFGSNTGDESWTLRGQNDWINAAIWDTGGIDTINMSGYVENAEIDLRQEAFSSTGGLTHNLAIAKGAVIENAIGGRGNDEINGNAARNRLEGRSGRDVLDSGGGNDVLLGHAGQDVLRGGIGNDLLNGGLANDILWGGAGRDTLIGSLGNDRLYGGAGIDTFFFTRNSGNDQIVEFVSGTDRIRFHGTNLDFDDLLITETNSGAKIDYGSGELTLSGVSASLLDTNDFIFT